MIPKYAEEFVSTIAEQDLQDKGVEQFQISRHVHSHGINVRFLGLVRSGCFCFCLFLLLLFFCLFLFFWVINRIWRQNQILQHVRKHQTPYAQLSCRLILANMVARALKVRSLSPLSLLSLSLSFLR